MAGWKLAGAGQGAQPQPALITDPGLQWEEPGHTRQAARRAHQTGLGATWSGIPIRTSAPVNPERLHPAIQSCPTPGTARVMEDSAVYNSFHPA